MKKIVKRVAILSLIFCLALSLLLIPVGCAKDNDNTDADSGNSGNTVQEKKAIIILPGIMGSNIVDTTTGNPLWAPLNKGPKMWELNSIADYMQILKKPEVKKLLDFDGEGGAYEWIYKMKVNADGSVNNVNAPQSLDLDGKSRFEKCSDYGTLDYYEKAYFYLKENFGDEYDVRIFEYDWRLNNMDSAIALENFINDNHYNDVVLIGHSMGGVLASTYLGRSEENRNKVDKFISLGAPFFGAHKALRVIENPLSMVGEGDMSKMLDTIRSMVDGMNGKGSFDKFFGDFMQFAYDLPTIYQLMPYADMVKGYAGDTILDMDNQPIKGMITIDGEAVTSYEQFMTFLKSRGYVNSRCANLMLDWQNEQYVEIDGKKVHASMAVDTIYFVGNELETELAVNFVNGEMTNCSSSLQGDGTVPLYSATCGLPLTDSRIVEFKGVSHGNLVYDDICLEKIKEVING